MLIVYSNKFFVSILFHFTLIFLKLEHALIIADLLNQNPTKKIMMMCKKIDFIRCCKYISFQSAECTIQSVNWRVLRVQSLLIR